MNEWMNERMNDPRWPVDDSKYLKRFPVNGNGINTTMTSEYPWKTSSIPSNLPLNGDWMWYTHVQYKTKAKLGKKLMFYMLFANIQTNIF